MQEKRVRFLEEGTATHSSILAWRIPWTEEPGGLPSIGSQRIGHDWSDLAQHPIHPSAPRDGPCAGRWGTTVKRILLQGPGWQG